MKKLRLFILLISLSLYFSGVKAAYYYSKASGASALQTRTNWGTNTDGTGTAPANFTTAGDTFEVRNTSSATIGAAWTVSGTNSRVIIGDGSSTIEFTVPSGFRLNATVIVKNAATLTINFLTVPTLDVLATGSTVKYTGAGTQAVASKTFYNLEIGGSGSKQTAGDITVNGSLTVNSTLDLNATGEELFGTLSGGLSGSGTLRTLSTAVTAPIPAGFSWPFLVEFYGTTQKIPDGTYSDLLLDGTSGVKTALGNISVSNSLDVETGNTLALAGFTLGGAFTSISGTGIITTTNTSSTPIPAGLTWSQTVTYASSGVAQTIVSGTYANLSITTGTDVNTASGDITIDNSGILNVAASNTLDLATFQLIMGAGASATGTGTIRTQNTSSTPLTAGITWTQTVLYNSASPQTVVDGQYVALTLTGGNRTFSTLGTIYVSGALNFGAGTITMTGSSLELNGASTQTITVTAGTTFNNLAITAGTTKTISGGAITIKGLLDIEAGTTLALGTNTLSSTTITTSGSGTLTTSNTGTTPIPANITWSFLVSYIANGNQTLVRGSYDGGLTLGGTAGTKTMNGNVSVGTSSGGVLTINTSRILSIGAGNTLTINGTIDAVQTGTITGSSTSDIVIGDNTTVAGSILMTQTSNATKSVRNFTLARNAGVNSIIIGNPMRIINLLTVTDGELNANGNLTLESTSATVSAQVAAVTGTGNITGNVTVERFIPGRAVASNVRWRFLASPVNTSNTISNNWQQQIFITGSGTGGTLCPSTPTANSNGFDATASNNASFYNWDKSIQNWVALPNTNATELVTGQGCRVFIRGTRAQGCSVFTVTPPTPNNVTLTATGTLAVGDQVLQCASTASGFELIGNPFQATIDWDLVSKTNIAGTIYGFKPDATTNGAYGTYNGGIGTNGMTKYISPGTAIWVQTDGSGNGSITISESDKNTAQAGFAYFKAGTEQSTLRTKLFIDTVSEYIDEVVLAVTPNSAWTYDMVEDAKKFGFASNQLALYTPSASDRYAICRVPGFDSVNNRINIDAKTVSGKSYTFKFEELSSFDPNTKLTLVDNFAGTTQDLASNDEYTFTTSTDPLSTDAGRFYIKIESNSNSLPVTLTSFVAKKDMNTTKLSWTTSSEVNSDKFIVERSKDLSSGFEAIGTVKASGTSSQVVSYTSVDKSPMLGIMNYYRLNQFDKNGAHTYSQVIAVDYSTKATSAVQVNYYPVPVSTLLTLEISNNKTPIDNTQGVTIFDVFGKKVATLNMTTSANGVYTVDMSSLSDGVYILQMAVDGEFIKHKFIKN